MPRANERTHFFCSLVFAFLVHWNIANIQYRVKRGVAVQHPTKYILDDEELQRVSTLARIELEDAKEELERAQNASKSMDKRIIAGSEDEDESEDVDEGAWVE